jgi:hypothetical protein
MNPEMNDQGISGAQAGAVRRRVRANVFWPAVAGALMLYFGLGDWIIPEISRVYTAAAYLYVWTLKAGGFAMLAVAGICLAGLRTGLLIDAVASGLIVVGLALPGVVFTLRGELNGILSLVFAALFGAAAVHSWREWVALRALDAVAWGGDMGRDAGLTASATGPRDVGELLRRTGPPAVEVHEEEAKTAPPDGYLAALGQEPEPDEPQGGES